MFEAGEPSWTGPDHIEGSVGMASRVGRGLGQWQGADSQPHQSTPCSEAGDLLWGRAKTPLRGIRKRGLPRQDKQG